MYYQLKVVGPTREFIAMDADINTPQEIADWFIGIREFMDQHDIDVDERYEMIHGMNADSINVICSKCGCYWNVNPGPWKCLHCGEKHEN